MHEFGWFWLWAWLAMIEKPMVVRDPPREWFE